MKAPMARLTFAEIRRRYGWSQAKVAELAGVSTGTVRLFEAAPDAVKDPRKRALLVDLYANLAR